MIRRTICIDINPHDEAAKVREYLKYDPESGLFIWVKRSGKQKIGSIAGTIHPSGYLRITVQGKKYEAHRLAWLLTYGVHPKNEIDHKNRCGLDNRLCNLREATATQNRYNVAAGKLNTSGIRGVSFAARERRWRAVARVNGKAKSLGYYKTKDEAAVAYERFAKQLHGEFYRG